jgi:hypothetical protein
MNILCILTAYNEIEYLPIKWEFCKRNGLYLYVIDNMSDDGTWEWLKENNIPSHRFDTDGEFHLKKLQQEIIRTTRIIEPDWVIYNGCDLFPATEEPLGTIIERIDKQGYNSAAMPCVFVANTGEERTDNPFKTYFYYSEYRKLIMIYKYDPMIFYDADMVVLPFKNATDIDGVMINYGGTKPPEEREETFKRRQKAWDSGMEPTHGSHYREGSRRGWVFTKEELKDIRQSDYFKYIVPLQDLIK